MTTLQAANLLPQRRHITAACLDWRKSVLSWLCQGYGRARTDRPVLKMCMSNITFSPRNNTASRLAPGPYTSDSRTLIEFPLVAAKSG